MKHAVPRVRHRPRWQLTAFLYSLRLFGMGEPDYDMDGTFDLLWNDLKMFRAYMARIPCILNEFRFEKSDCEVWSAMLVGRGEKTTVQLVQILPQSKVDLSAPTFVQHMRGAK